MRVHLAHRAVVHAPLGAGVSGGLPVLVQNRRMTEHEVGGPAAQSVCGVFAGPVRLAVIPAVPRMVLLRRASGHRNKGVTDDYRKKTLPNFHNDLQ